MADIKTILAPIDCGHRSRALLRSAAALARCVGARLVILHVYEPVAYAPAHCGAQQLRECVCMRQRDAEARLAEVCDTLSADPAIRSARLVAVGGETGREICSVAKEVGADMIVVSTHGYRGLNHLFLGSKAEQLIRRAPCPTLILPPLAQGGEEERDLIELRVKRPDAEAAAC